MVLLFAGPEREKVDYSLAKGKVDYSLAGCASELPPTMVTTVKEPVLEIENISDPFIGMR